MPTIRELRKSNYLTQEELAAKAGIARRTLSRVETGAECPSGPTIRKIAKAVRVRPQEIEFIKLSVFRPDELTQTSKEYLKALNTLTQKLFKGSRRPIPEKDIQNIKKLHARWFELISNQKK
jgi:transcriptional regulator with XRE-family HTH domain